MEACGGFAISTSITRRRLPAFFTNPYFVLRDPFHSQLLKSSSVFDGNRKNTTVKRNHAMDDRSYPEGEKRMPRGSSLGKWSNQKRLLTLFKQIETSISQEKARITEERDSKSTMHHHTSFDSVLEALEQSSVQGKDETIKYQTPNNEDDIISSPKNKAFETDKEPALPDPQTSTLKVTRPPSNFIKKSPIPLPSVARISSIERNAVGGRVDEEPLELKKMKLTELKQAAKARGFKGYSKMNKSELVDLLRA